MVALSLVFSLNAFAVDVNEVQKLLKTTGAEGWIHGAVESQGTYAFTFRGTDFFDYIVMSLVSTDPAMLKQLAAISRHDKVRIKGDFLPNPSPQKHILVSSIEVLKPFQQPYPVHSYDHEAKLPDDLMNKTSATFLVHAIGGDGHILVVEYKDSIVPIFVKNADLAKDLYRGDLVKLQIGLQRYPNQPVHVKLNEKSPKPIEVLEAIREIHGKPTPKEGMEGALILFPKSPEIMFNVFALKQDLPEGLSRQYTLVNFDDPAVFAKIRQKLQTAFDKYPNAYINGRNKLVSTKIRVKATGILNEVNASQANPQILLSSPDSIQIIE